MTRAAILNAPHLATLQELDLTQNNLGPEAMRWLASANPGALRVLDLQETGLGDAGAALLAGATNLRLRWLNLEKNSIGPEGIAALARQNLFAALETLDLTYNPIGDGGLVALAEGLRGGSLSELTLFGCELRNDGVIALADSLPGGRLRELDLSVNFVGDPAGVALARWDRARGSPPRRRRAAGWRAPRRCRCVRSPRRAGRPSVGARSIRRRWTCGSRRPARWWART